MKKKIIFFCVTFVAAVFVLCVGFIVITRGQSGVPAKVRHEASFVLFYPAKTSDFQMVKNKTSYDPATKVVNIRVKSKDGVEITLNEQATPQQFSDIPQYFPALVEKLNPYGSFESANGHVDLTHPKELKGGQQAIVKEKGTLLFAHPSRELSNDQWRRFFNNLSVSK